ncbi:MAG: hypothetical protein GY699_22930 [Desulfobacteraceae bacterium]|nr:hypothetical protein [Desulfobacteraceae bacterium]
MDPNKFRESRLAINRVCENINEFIAKKLLEESKVGFKRVNTLLNRLKPKAEGEIQERSVKNLGVKLNVLAFQIAKLKPKKKPKKKKLKNVPPPIVWDEDRIGTLSPVYLNKVFANMGGDKKSNVCFGTTGKGVRPSYQIEFENQEYTAFSGSGHSPLKKTIPPGTPKISQPFPYSAINSILSKK